MSTNVAHVDRTMPRPRDAHVPAADRPAGSRRADRALVGLVCALVWMTCLVLYTRANTFPYWYHPDEEGKARQALLGRRNYNHPQLLLETAQVVTTVARLDRADIQAGTVAGRWVAAGFAAGAVVAFALAGRRVGGWPGFATAAAAVGLSPSLLLYAHYFKEDTALIFGIGLVVWAGRALADAVAIPADGTATPPAPEEPVTAAPMAATAPPPSPAAPAGLASRVRDYLPATSPGGRRDEPPTRRAVRRGVFWLGAACGVAVSGKYVGLAALAIALPLLWAWRRRLPPGAWTRFGLAFLAAVLVINYRSVGNVATWQRKFGQQVVDGVLEHKGLTMAKPNGYFVRAVGQEVPTPVLVLAVAVAVLAVVTWRRRSAWDAAVVLFPAGFLCLVSFSSAPNNRHVLPVVVMCHFLAAAGVAWAVELFTERRPLAGTVRPTTAVAAAFVVAAAVLGPRCVNYVGQFADDSRERARRWVAANVPPGTLVLQDTAAALDEPAPGQPGVRPGPGGTRIMTYNFAPDAGDFDSLTGIGVRYIVVCDIGYGRYFDRFTVPTADFGAEFARRRAWYERLFREGEPVWETRPEPHTHSSTNPIVRVYRIPAPATETGG